MKIQLMQTEPIHLYECECKFQDLLHWLNVSALPDKMIMNFNGCSYVFRTPQERKQWALGFECAWSILSQ